MLLVGNTRSLSEGMMETRRLLEMLRLQLASLEEKYTPCENAASAFSRRRDKAARSAARSPICTDLTERLTPKRLRQKKAASAGGRPD
jgi:hypothetical protein